MPLYATLLESLTFFVETPPPTVIIVGAVLGAVILCLVIVIIVLLCRKTSVECCARSSTVRYKSLNNVQLIMKSRVSLVKQFCTMFPWASMASYGNYSTRFNVLRQEMCPSANVWFRKTLFCPRMRMYKICILNQRTNGIKTLISM